MKEKNYCGGITNEQFLFYEMRTTALQMFIENDKEKLYQIIKEQNLYQLPTQRNMKRTFNTCVRRIELLESDTLLHQLAKSSAEVAKQINLYALMLDNGIVWDFMVRVIGEKYRTQDLSFSKKDVNDFLFELQDEIPKMNSWTDSTVAKIRQVLIKSIVECGYLNSPSSKELNYVYLFPELEDDIRQKGLTEFLPAFNNLNDIM